MSSVTDVDDRECQQLQAVQPDPSMPHPLSESSRIDAVVGDSNPFETDGLLSRKADYILSHSTIKRNELRISDPDLATKHAQTVECVRSEAVCSVEQAPANGQLPVPHSGGVVEAEVGQIVVSVPDQQQAEQVKLVSNKCKCKCCSVQ